MDTVERLRRINRAIEIQKRLEEIGEETDWLRTELIGMLATADCSIAEETIPKKKRGRPKGSKNKKKNALHLIKKETRYGY